MMSFSNNEKTSRDSISGSDLVNRNPTDSTDSQPQENNGDSSVRDISNDEGIQGDSQMSPDISLSTQRTLRYCDVEAEQQDSHSHASQESSDSVETLNEPPTKDTHVELNNKILEQLSLTCQNLKNSVESHQKAERERERGRRENKSPNDNPESIESSSDSHEVIPELSNKPRPESLSLPRPLQAIERERKESASKSNTHHSLKSARSSQMRVTETHPEQEEQGAHFIDSKSLSTNLPSGTIVRKGNMIEFVADNLEEMIKLSSPLAPQDSSGSGSRRSSVRSTVSASSSTSFATSSGLSRSPSSLLQQSPDDIPPIDAAAVIELENHARRVADSLDLMMGNIGNNLHKMSAITIGCEDAYKRSVDITCDAVDASIKSMYALMAKCEEVSAAMGPVTQLAAQIKEIKRILDLFEAQLSDK